MNRNQELYYENKLLNQYYDEYDRNSAMEELVDQKVSDRIDEEIQEKLHNAIVTGGEVKLSYEDGTICVEVLSQSPYISHISREDQNEES